MLVLGGYEDWADLAASGPRTRLLMQIEVRSPPLCYQQRRSQHCTRKACHAYVYIRLALPASGILDMRSNVQFLGASLEGVKYGSMGRCA